MQTPVMNSSARVDFHLDLAAIGDPGGGTQNLGSGGTQNLGSGGAQNVGHETGYTLGQITSPGAADDAGFSLMLLSISVCVFCAYLLWSARKFEVIVTKSIDTKTHWPEEIAVLIGVISVLVALWIFRLTILNYEADNLLIFVLSSPSRFISFPLVIGALLSALAFTKFLLSMFIIRAHQHEPEFPIHSIGAPTIGIGMSLFTFAGSIASIIGLALFMGK